MIHIIGAGLAGSEAAYQLLKRGFAVNLYEMRPFKSTGAHKTDKAAELVCSNSLGALSLDKASGLLKRELQLLDSLIIKAAYKCQIRGGNSLVVDRKCFSNYIEKTLKTFENLFFIRKEITSLDIFEKNDIIIVATGPLTSESFFYNLKKLLKEEFLYFFDAVSPIIDAESIDYSKTYWQSRYSDNKDYLNCPLTKEEYELFYKELINAKVLPFNDIDNIKLFESCMPIEEIAKRGKDTMRFGPLKPVGLINPKTNKRDYAVVQLRREDRYDTMFNIVGFQTRLLWPEQKRVFSLIPALKNAVFLRYGVMHKNIYINSPQLLNKTLNLKANKNIYFAGQITGVEGYLESTAMGLVSALNIYKRLKKEKEINFAQNTAIGALINYITTKRKNFQPMKFNFGLLNIEFKRNLPRKERNIKKSYNALNLLQNLKKEL